MPSTNLISSSFNSSLISPNNSSSAVISALKEVMEGLGLHDMSADIYQAEAEHELKNQKLATAVKYHLETNDTYSRAQLIEALNEKLTETQAEYDHAIKQQKYYEEQAKIEAEQKSTNSSSYLSQWSHWLLKTFFGSTTEQQIEKYKTIASNRSLKIEKLSDTLNSLQVDDTESDHYVRIHNSENVSLAHFPEIINLGSLNGVQGFRMYGENELDSCFKVNKGGDINSDGYDDLIVGAPGYPQGSYKGRSYVVFGESKVGGSGVLNLSSLNGVNGFKLDGENNWDQSSHSVSAAGDINGDEHDDFIIGAQSYPPFGSSSQRGRSYLVFARAEIGSSGILNLSSLNGTNGFKLDGENEGDLSGSSVSGAGDINGDGYYDLIIGAPSYPAAYHTPPYGKGRSYVVFGSKELGSSEVLNLSNLTGLNGFKLDGEKDGDESGFSVSTAGDINGDGYDDLIIGATRNYYSRGRSYVVFGSQQVGNTGILNLSSLDGMTGFKLDGEENGDFSGAVVSSAGDINGDGVTDLTIGAFGPSFQGRSYVVFGDIPPVLLNNSLNLDRGEKLLLTSIYLAAIDRNHDNSSLVFVPTNITHGYFENINQPGIVLANFTQQEITSLKIRFIHDGSLNSPTYNITVRSSGIAWTGPSAVIVNFNPMLIVLVNNQLTINQSQSLQLTTSNLLASCNISNSNLTFIINNITHGAFLINGNLSLSPTVSIPQQAIEAEEVAFIQDGSSFAPSYQVSVADPWIETAPMSAQISFNSLPFFLVNNQLSIKQNQTLIFDSKNLMATRNDVAIPSFTFMVTHIAHGIFNINGQTSASQISFVQQAILSAQVSFTQDGSRSAPSYTVAVSDGWNQTIPTLANISLLLKPLLSSNQFLVSLN